jgi:flagellin
VRALGGVQGTTDLGASSTTSVQNIALDATNLASLRTSGFTEFVFNGAGFAGANEAKLSVNLAGVVDTNTLVTAINSAIDGFSSTSAAGQAFKNAGIRAVVNTDSTGKQQLAFTSSSTAFQVKAGDRLANAVLGNFSTGATGASLDITVTGDAKAIDTTAANTVKVLFLGGGLSSPTEIEVTTGIGDTQADVIGLIESAIAGNSELSGGGFAVSQVGGNQTQFTNSLGESFQVRVVGDTDNTLGFGTAELGAGDAARYNTITSAYAAPAAGATIDFSIQLEGEATTQTFSITVASGATAQDLVNGINAAINNNSTLSGAGLRASTAGGVTLETTTAGGGGNFLVSVNDDDANPLLTSFTDADAEVGVVAGTVADSGVEATVNSGGAQATTSASADPISFTGLTYGNDVQNLNVTAKDATGAVQAININLTNANALTVGDAVNTINSTLQASNNSTLQKIVAVRERDGAGTEGIRFLANLPGGFNVAVGDLANDHGVANATPSDLLLTSGQLEGGAIADISSRENAENAVTLLAGAINKLGTLQADVGRGQNRLQFAISLATTQVTNISSAESRIRDADLAQEAANLTRAGIAQQAGVAALAQANSAPQAVLALLRG